MQANIVGDKRTIYDVVRKEGPVTFLGHPRGGEPVRVNTRIVEFHRK